MSAPENEKGFAAPTAKPKQYISDSTPFNTKNHKASQAENRAKSLIYDAQLAAKLDDIVARAEQQTKYALSDHRFMCGMARHESAPRPRRVTIKAGRDSLALVLPFDAEIKLWAYARRLSREVCDLPYEDRGDAE